MDVKKSVGQREKELQSLLATPWGRGELEDLASRYCAADGSMRREGASVVTCILVHERKRGLIG